jgi:hypothetical protein
MDTLAVQLTIPPVGFVGDFHSQVSAPCRAHQMKGRVPEETRPELAPLVVTLELEPSSELHLKYLAARVCVVDEDVS